MVTRKKSAQLFRVLALQRKKEMKNQAGAPGTTRPGSNDKSKREGEKWALAQAQLENFGVWHWSMGRLNPMPSGGAIGTYLAHKMLPAQVIFFNEVKRSGYIVNLEVEGGFI